MLLHSYQGAVSTGFEDEASVPGWDHVTCHALTTIAKFVKVLVSVFDEYDRLAFEQSLTEDKAKDKSRLAVPVCLPEITLSDSVGGVDLTWNLRTNIHVQKIYHWN